MEIYKLKDEVPNEKRIKKNYNNNGRQRNDDDSGQCNNDSGLCRITDLRQGARNPNRVNVFVDEKYAFSLDITQVVDYKLKVGKIISSSEWGELEKASEFGKLYQRALEWVLVRPRSVRELRDYLRRKNIQSEAKERQREWKREREIADLIAKGEEIEVTKKTKINTRVDANRKKKVKYDVDDLVIERLCEKGYVDDKKFAEYYVQNRFVKKGVSKKRLEIELIKKGIEKGIIEEVLGVRNDEDEIQKMIAKKRRKYDDEKLIMYLARQGFSFDDAREAVRKYGVE